MVITRTPFRISFFGGGTDYSPWYQKNGGMAISTSIDKYCYVTARHLPPFFDHKYRIRYTRREEKSNVEDIEHPSVRECMKYLDYRDYLEMVHTSDLPAMSGLGSSSAFTVGFLHSLHGLMGNEIPTRHDLALQAIHVEQDLIKENVGSQDQVAAAVGGLNRIDFSSNGITAMPIAMPDASRATLENRLLLYFTGFQRYASVIAAEQMKSIPDKTAELTAMMDLARRAEGDLAGGKLDDFGALLDEGWRLKKTLSSKITTPGIDEIYTRAKTAGALGGKLLGAGGGGFMLFYAPEEKHPAIQAALSNLIHVPFHFENSGSQIIYQNI